MRFRQAGLLAVCLSIACTAPFRRGPLPPQPAEVLIGRIFDQAEKLVVFEGWGELTLATPEQSFRGSVQLKFRQPDSLWVKVEGPLGIDVLHAVFHGDSTFLYYPRDHVAYRGGVSAVLDDRLPVELESTETILRYTGLFVPGPAASGDTVNQEEGRYHLRRAGGRRLIIDHRGPVVTHCVQWNPDGTPLWTWEGIRFRRTGPVRLPALIRLADYRQRQRMNLFYERIRVNRKLPAGWCELSIPKGVEIIEY